MYWAAQGGPAPGRKPWVCADVLQGVSLPIPPPPPYSISLYDSPCRPMWSHTGFPNFQALSGRTSDQRSSLQKPVASRVSLAVETNRSKVVTGYTVSMVCDEPFQVIWERLAMGTMCLGNDLPQQCVCVIRRWGRLGHGGHCTYQTTPCSPRDSDSQRSCIGTPRGWGQSKLYSPASRRSRMSELPIFKPLGFSSRSCCSTGRLMRS